MAMYTAMRMTIMATKPRLITSKVPGLRSAIGIAPSAKISRAITSIMNQHARRAAFDMVFASVKIQPFLFVPVKFSTATSRKARQSDADRVMQERR